MMRQALYLPFSVIILLVTGCSAVIPGPDSATVAMQHTPCPEPRAKAADSVACTMNYLPVCAIHTEQRRSTQPNSCSACANPDVIGYIEGQCP